MAATNPEAPPDLLEALSNATDVWGPKVSQCWIDSSVDIIPNLSKGMSGVTVRSIQHAALGGT